MKKALGLGITALRAKVMKKTAKKCILGFFVLSVIACGNSTAEPLVFGGPFSVGIVENGKLNIFYVVDDDDPLIWEKAAYDFALPKGHKEIIGGFDFFLIAVNNQLKTYTVKDNELSELATENELKLPPNYRKVFLGFEGGIGVAAGNTVSFFYKDGDNDWHQLPWQQFPDEFSFTLPKGYKDVFSYNGTIGVVVDNNVVFFQFNTKDGSWNEASEYAFELPPGARGAFVLSLDSEVIGIVFDGRIEFYGYDSSGGYYDDGYLNGEDYGWVNIGKGSALVFSSPASENSTKPDSLPSILGQLRALLGGNKQQKVNLNGSWYVSEKDYHENLGSIVYSETLEIDGENYSFYLERISSKSAHWQYGTRGKIIITQDEIRLIPREWIRQLTDWEKIEEDFEDEVHKYSLDGDELTLDSSRILHRQAADN
ncbi:MAG: hypothetical protein LBJ31_11555 [Treponema sp.]|jgi:hypothetical protein|nr:hypothetical protein [Treponema sp.]